MRLQRGDKMLVSCSHAVLLDALRAALQAVTDMGLDYCWYCSIHPNEGKLTSSTHMEARGDLAECGAMITILRAMPDRTVERDWTIDVMEDAAARGVTVLAYVMTDEAALTLPWAPQLTCRAFSEQERLTGLIAADLRELMAGEH